MKYLAWKQLTLTPAESTPANITAKYNEGFVFTRVGKGVMNQTRSARIDLSRFEPDSENRRILKKTEDLSGPEVQKLATMEYDWKIGKLAKDFYDQKFGSGIMSAQKVKTMLSDASQSNFDSLLKYGGETSIGYVICYINDTLLHYSYPFYDLDASPKDMGLGMMLRAITYAKEQGLRYVYLGSLQRPTDTYKLQFSGLEWFDGTTWKTDLDEVKKVLADAAIDSAASISVRK